MSDWNRSTKECTLPAIHPDMMAAIQQHIETYNLGDILKGTLVCIETTSTKKKGLFGLGGQKVVTECAIVTPAWLILVVKSDDSGAAALTVRLDDMTVSNYEDSPAYKVIQDCGIQVSGAFTGRVGMHGNQRIAKFVGLGSEPAALNFRHILHQAMQAVRK